MKILDTRHVPTGDLKPYAGNARTHNLDVITRSLERNGQYRAVVVQQKGMRILAGHGTVEAALALGWETVLAHLVACTAAEAKRIVLVDNRANDLAGYNQAGLAQLLEGLDTPALDGTGYGADDVDRLLRSLGDGGGRPSDPGARPAAPRSKPGDVVELGAHRLMCGDATNPEHVAALMGDDRARMVWTDPPYGVSYQVTLDDPSYARRRRKDGKTVTNDELTDDALRQLLRDSLGLALRVTTPGAAVYVASPGGPRNLDFAIVLGELRLCREVLIWVKDQLVFGRQDYHWRHEPIFYGWKDDAAHFWAGGRSQDTVFEIPRPHVSEEHPTMKPVALVERMLDNSSELGDAVYDPFGGSGTTLIACEELGRRAYLMELDPGYCDVIIDRYHRHIAGDG